jgi:glyoxylase-like metal-dependent hydrolase (beta-lactamase superfamily II)
MAAFLACALIPFFASAQAEETKTREIWKAGDMAVTAIQDLPSEMPVSIFSGPASEKEKSKYFTNGKAEASINAFLLRAGGKVVLFDAGAGTLFQSPGKLPDALAGQGIKPEEVDFVLLTHMHMDHIGGLLQGEKRAFPKAKVMVSKPELDSWMALAEKDPSNATADKVKTVAAAYGADLQTFAFGGAPFPGVMALEAIGHTPGHTAFLLTADGKDLLIVGDLLHAMSLQFPLPDECSSYDMDPAQAAATRKRLFAFAAQKKMPIAGMHFPFANTVGMVKKSGKGWMFERVK